MVLAELAKVPEEARKGPLIVNPNTGFPYRKSTYYHLWKRVAKAAGITEGVWNRDLRAGAATEGGTGRRQDRLTWPSSSAIPTSVPRPKSMTAIGSKLIAVWHVPASLIATRTERKRELRAGRVQ